VYHPLECSPLASQRSLVLLFDLAEGGIGLILDQLHCLLYGDVVRPSVTTAGRPEAGFFD
jgi:hypothetical protein